MKTRIGLTLGAILILTNAGWAQDSLNITQIGWLNIAEYEVVDIAIAGDYAFIAAGYDGLYVINVANPFAPVEVGSYDTPGWARAVAVSGNYAYVADEGAGLRVIDVSNPAAPVEVGHISTPDAAMDVVIAGIYAYVADWTAGLWVINMSHPSQPAGVGFCSLPDWAYGVAVAGNYAYVADCYSGLRVVDVSNPAAPVEVGFYDTPGSAFNVAVLGSLAYVADQDNGLRIINVSIPSTPMEVSYSSTESSASGIAVAGNYVYVSDLGAGFQVFNVVNPSAPVEVGHYYTSQMVAYNVAVAEGLVYVTDEEDLRIFDCSACFNLSQLMISLSSWVNPPFEIPGGGGNFDYAISVHNFTSTQQFFDAWIMVRLPNSTWYGPLLGPFNLTLPVGASLVRQRTQNVPGNAPAGNYLYEARLGDYPDSVWANDSFTFTKLPEEGDGNEVGDWSITGEPFPSEIEEIRHSSFVIRHLEISPNPFNPSTVIRYQIPDARYVSLRVYDTAGRLVATLADGWREAGEHQVTFDGSGLPSGIYLYHLQAGGLTTSGKMVLVK